MKDQKTLLAFFQKPKVAEEQKAAPMSGSSAAGKRKREETTDAVRDEAPESLELVLGSPMAASWEEKLRAETAKPYMKSLATFLSKERLAGKVIYPPQHQVFAAYNACSFEDVKVVIIGQDPYHGPGQAHGLSFSVQPGVKQPPSLRNMVKEAEACCNIRPIKSGCLQKWADQGVLLLNTVLTVEKSKAFSHRSKGWEQFTDATIKLLNNRRDKPVVFLLWGKPAQVKGKGIDKSTHRVICSSHPSPLANTKASTHAPFTGSRCFQKANDALVEFRESPIDWNL
ncbi:unnamed protein product [Chrysoparadoxa australica]